jgi:hypothetical protein
MLNRCRFKREIRSKNFYVQAIVKNVELGLEKLPNPSSLPLLLCQQI